MCINGSCSGRLFYAGYSKIVAGNLGFDQWVNDSGCVRIHGGKIFDETRIRIVDGSGWMDSLVDGRRSKFVFSMNRHLGSKEE